MSRWGKHWAEHGPHRFERGDLRYLILERLESRPSYGYEIIRDLEERFHGFYTPSAGVVYPTLQWLEDLGYVTAAEQDGRKVYTITDEGRRFLTAERPRVEEIRERMRRWWGPFDPEELRDEVHDLMHDMRDMGRDLRHRMRWADPDKLRRVREVVVQATREIDDILREPSAAPSAEGQGTEPAGGTPPQEDSTTAA